MKPPAPGSKAFDVQRLRLLRAAGKRPARISTAAVAAKPINAPVQASAQPQETTMKKVKKKAAKPAAKKRGVSEAAANLKAAKSKAAKPNAEKTTVPALEVAAFLCRDGGASMDDLVKKFGIEAHPMRAKIHYVRHKLGYGVETKDGRYVGTAPKAA